MATAAGDGMMSPEAKRRRVESTADAARNAARGGDLAALRSLPFDSLFVQGEDGVLPAMEAAAGGHVDVLRHIVEVNAAASFAVSDRRGRSAVHHAAIGGNAEALRVIGAQPGVSTAALAAPDDTEDSVSYGGASSGGVTPAGLAAYHGHGDVLRALHELGAGASLAAPACKVGAHPVHLAAWNGHGSVLRVLHELGLAETFSAADKDGWTPAHAAAWNGHGGVLRVLHELGPAETLSAAAKRGYTPAHLAAQNGHEGVLRVLHELGAAETLSAVDEDGFAPAYIAAQQGHEGALRVLHELGAAETLSAASKRGNTPAHLAARQGHEGVLRVLHELGAAETLSAASKNGSTPAHRAAQNGHENVLRVLHELGSDVLTARDKTGRTPIHSASIKLNLSCLKALHAIGLESTRPAFESARQMANAMTALAQNDKARPFSHAHDLLRHSHAHLVSQLEKYSALAFVDDAGDTPAHLAAERQGAGGESQVSCLRYFATIGGLDGIHASVAAGLTLLTTKYSVLLDHPALLPLPTKRQWLSRRLGELVTHGWAGAQRLDLVADRAEPLRGLCAQLGVDETSGAILDGAVPLPLHVTFRGENGVGDGVRREWLQRTVTEITDLDHGLFLSCDGGRTLQPHPGSAQAAPDHLSHFALLGRMGALRGLGPLRRHEVRRARRQQNRGHRRAQTGDCRLRRRGHGAVAFPWRVLDRPHQHELEPGASGRARSVACCRSGRFGISGGGLVSLARGFA